MRASLFPSLALVFSGACLSCTPESIPGPERLGCGPCVESQMASVRVVVLERLVSDLAKDLKEHHRPIPSLVLADESVLEPGSLVMMSDPDAAVMQAFAHHEPPVISYSASLEMRGSQGSTLRAHTIIFVVGEVCWSGATRAAVKAKVVFSADDDREIEVGVLLRGGTWVVSSVANSAGGAA